MAAQTIIKDDLRPELARIKKELQALQGMEIHVGIQGDAGSDLLRIASVHEYGATIKMTDKMRRYLGAMGLFDDGDGDEKYTPPEGAKKGYVNIPERSFIRASYDTGMGELSQICAAAIRHIYYDGWTAEQAANSIGAQAVQMTQSFIDAGIDPPKSKFTQERSTQKTPLVDSGRLRESITWEIEGGG